LIDCGTSFGGGSEHMALSPKAADGDSRILSDRWNVPELAGAATFTLGGAVIAGWALDLPLLRSVLPHAIAMQPITALALILGGCALIAARRPRLPSAIVMLFAVAILLLAGADLAQFLSGADFGIDFLFFPDAVSRQPFAMAHPGRMAEATTLCFLLAAIAFFLVGSRGRSATIAYSVCATLILLPVAMTLLGYMFGPAPLPGMGWTNVALPTASGLGLLAIGLLALRPDVGWVPLIHGGTVGAAAARRLLPIVLVVPVAAAWLARHGSAARFYPPEIQLALMTTLSIGLLGAITIWAASRFNRLDAILAAGKALREAEHRLMQSQAELIHVSRVSELGAMGSMLAHELNQPLTAIANYISAAQHVIDSGKESPREQKRILAHALASTQRAAEIIRRLRAFVIKGEVEQAPHDVNNIIEDALILALAGGVLKGTGTEMRFDPAARWVLADPIQIQQVLNNLFRNAVDVMAGMERRELLISTRRDGATVEISVADTGPGLAEEEPDRLFESFYSSKGSGMGLGLSISRTIVEAHGGRIWAESGDPGAIFRFTLPAATAPRRQIEAEAA
jgi:signal transduction histidine kinase